MAENSEKPEKPSDKPKRGPGRPRKVGGPMDIKEAHESLRAKRGQLVKKRTRKRKPGGYADQKDAKAYRKREQELKKELEGFSVLEGKEKVVPISPITGKPFPPNRQKHPDMSGTNDPQPPPVEIGETSHILTPEEEEQALKLRLRLQLLTERERQQDDFLTFVKKVWPEFIAGPHHKIFAEKLNRIARGELKRLIVNMAPRHTKSIFSSFLFPAWMMGRDPTHKIIEATHTTDLAVDFGRQVKNMLDSDVYREVFEDVKLAPDAKAAGRWNTTDGGMYYAVGVGTNLAGRGGDLIVIDDPHSENSASATALQSAWEWYTGGPRQRCQPGAAILVVATRWGELDLTGRLLKQMATNPDADQWEVIQFPMELPSGNPVWPQYWSKQEMLLVKNSIPPYRWNAQYQQAPTGELNAIIKREDWKVWPHKYMPNLEYIMQSWDTAFSAKEQADYSACTTWGVFNPKEYFNDAEVTRALILLDAKKDRWDFHRLKEEALTTYKYWDPDMVLIEAKASGMPLTHELRNIGVPVVNFTPTRGGQGRGTDKTARMHTIQPVFASGMIYAPEDRWAKEVIEEVAGFPNAEFDDYTDSTSQAVSRFRQGGFVKLPSDYYDDEEARDRRPRQYY